MITVTDVDYLIYVLSVATSYQPPPYFMSALRGGRPITYATDNTPPYLENYKLFWGSFFRKNAYLEKLVMRNGSFENKKSKLNNVLG